MSNHIDVLIRAAGPNRQMRILLTWQGQPIEPPREADTWPDDIDRVSVDASVFFEDSEGEPVLVPPVALTVVGWELGNGRPQFVFQRFWSTTAADAESAARAAVSGLVSAVTGFNDTRQARTELRRQRAEAAGVPSWVRAPDRGGRP